MNNYRENKNLEIDGQRFCQENGTIRKIELEVQRRKKMKKEEKGMKKMIAKDGKLFDIDNIKKPSKSHQVEIIISKTKRQTS